jgi:hypothetical protein
MAASRVSTYVMSFRELRVVGRRSCAVLAAGSAALDAAMVGHAANVAVAVAVVGMIVGCLYCARDLWFGDSLGVWCVVALMNLAMIAVHLPLPEHHHLNHSAAAGHAPTIMALATAISAVEVTVAVAVLVAATRGRSAIYQPAEPPSQGAAYCRQVAG